MNVKEVGSGGGRADSDSVRGVTGCPESKEEEMKRRFWPPGEEPTGAGGSREHNPAAGEQGSGDGTRGDPYNISP
ncbi:hypothetical protein HPB52_002974 [Rhipicephalus sanguineus]|uniref:Uncharacterized protein n=1 Tax=Rhipicephalus sanguineus TaxID=34632 RepID=A0A9D4QAJ0_RHISA|nr:hypothetical protein HPB52_002974 [Rhipicephalus sanguineus]